MLDKMLWVDNGDQKDIFLRHAQPMTATQIARQRGLSDERCSYILGELKARRLMWCLNPNARRSRLFWLTRLGRAWQRRLRRLDGMPPLAHDCPDIDWELYGDVCYSHRSAVIKALAQPMQPAQIKRRALARDPHIRISANNVRDVIRFLLARGVVRSLKLKRRAHPVYELTDTGTRLQRLLLQAGVRR